MPWREDLAPRRMARVAVVAPETRWRAVLGRVADTGVVEPEQVDRPDDATAAALDRARREHPDGPDGARLAARAVDAGAAAAAGRVDLLAGEAELERVSAAGVARGGVRAVAGWAPASALPRLAEELAPLGGSVVELPAPAGQDPPTAWVATRRTALRPLVDTYATVPYRDIDPTWFAAAAYVVMFGMMFGDVGDGALLAVAGIMLWRSRHPRLAGVRRVWPLVTAMGAAAAVFGLLYGELFGPTGLVPALWLHPLDEPTRLLAAGIGMGTGLLAISYALGAVNRWREGGIALALYAPSGLAGAGLFVALALVAAGALSETSGLWLAGLVLGALALALVAVGLRVAAGPGAAGALQASVEVVDVVVRLGSNVVSFARLAAFGLTHAALSQVVWDATTGLWAPSLAAVAAVVVFVVGHVLAFGLEALVAGVQALRLEYYELFSRIFASEGRPFAPWHVPSAGPEESP